ncbi:MAG: NYN domain-containing protein [Acidimicrobiia bacterium]|nr:NYN domain-containing protein [Acidimicrobiia bacterium]
MRHSPASRKRGACHIRGTLWTTRGTRVAAYVDGFSVYHGLREKFDGKYLWLDFRALIEFFVLDHQELVTAKYFTSRVKKPEESRLRRALYLDALEARGGLEIVKGKFEHRPYKCPGGCGHEHDRPKEKMSDVNIAVSMLMDAQEDVYDVALLICADADLIPAVRAVEDRYDRTVIVISPRGRTSDDLKKNASAALHISDTRLARSQLPDPLIKGADRYDRPPEWH